MQRAILIVGLLSSFSGLAFQGTIPVIERLIDSHWQLHTIQAAPLQQLTAGRPLPFAAGGSVDPLQGQPTVRQVYLIQPHILAVEITTGMVIPGEQVPYQAQHSDRIEANRTVKRRHQVIGALVGKQRDLLYTVDQFVGTDLSPQWAQSRNSFRLSASDDPAWGNPQAPTQVFQKSKPNDLAEIGQEKRWAKRHTLYLQWPQPLQVGKTYTLSFRGLPLDSVTFIYDPQRQRSEAVHVSQIGFRPQDPVKVGFLSTWMGTGGALEYSPDMTFWVIDDATQAIAYTGKTRLSVASDTTEDPYRNYNQTPVYALEFPALEKPGIYRLCVETVGCSISFPLADAVWKTTFTTSVRGLYHQRSGIAIGPPFTTYERPRAFHPDDGVQVYQSTATLMNVDMGLGHENAFEALVAGKTDTLVPNAWGGYFDAGDWDRRVQHLSVAQALLELMELFPQQMEAIALNIPESSNNLPDVLDEALWAIDFYQRLQHPDGGVPGGIESAEHPQRGEASWQESLTIMAYAPDIWASYWYASAAAQAAFVVQPYDIKRAEAYEETALRAFAYAEQRYPKPPADGWPFPVRDLRNLAALQFWRLTNQDRWHQIFLQDTLFKTANIPLSEYGVHDQAEAAFLYARLAPNQVDPQIQTHARQSILAAADTMAALTLSTGFAWSKEHPMAPVGWGTSWASPREARVAAWAYTLTQDPKYLAAILRATQFPLGANPDNISYTTGLGERSPQNPLILDQRILGVAPPPGITVYGPLDISRDIYQDYWFTKYWAGEQMVPAPPNWPPTELYIDVHMNPAMSEFTVQETIGPSAYVWGYLAAQP